MNDVKIILDIETIPCDENTRSLLPPIKLDANQYPKESAIYDETLSVLKEKQFLDTALDGTFGRIICIGLLIVDSSEVKGLVLYGLNERQILNEFWKTIGAYRKIQFITHNGLGFDLPFILKRSIIHKIKPTYFINLARFRHDYVFDTMAVWANWDTRNYVKLDTLAKVLNLGEKSGDGANVYDMFQNGKLDDIASYCFHDVYLTYAAYSRMVYTNAVDKELINITKREL